MHTRLCFRIVISDLCHMRLQVHNRFVMRIEHLLGLRGNIQCLLAMVVRNTKHTASDVRDTFSNSLTWLNHSGRRESISDCARHSWVIERELAISTQRILWVSL